MLRLGLWCRLLECVGFVGLWKQLYLVMIPRYFLSCVIGTCISFILDIVSLY